MANYYWVGGSATWDSTAGSKWSSSSGGAASYIIAPTIADDVYFTAASGTVNVVFASGVNCRSLNFTGFTGSFTGASATNTLNIYGGFTAGSGMTLTPASNTYNFLAINDNGGAGWPITMAGKTIAANVTFNGVGGKWTLQDALTFPSSGGTTLTAGHLDTNNQTVNGWYFTTGGAGAKTLTLGSSTLTFSSGNTGISIGGSNLTLNAGTSTVKVVATANHNGFGTGITWYNVVLEGAGSPSIWNLTCQNLTRTGTASPNDGLGVYQPITVLGTLTITGNSSTNRVLCYSTLALGSPMVITAGAVSLTDVDFMDIAIVGPTGSTITSDSFNRADGSLGTTDAAAGGSPLAWTANDGTWNIDTNKAASTSSGLVYRSATVDAGVTDMAVEAVVTPGSQIWGLNARFTDQNNRIFVQHNGTQLAAGQVQGGTSTTVFTANVSFSAGDRFRVVLVGNGIAAYKNDVFIVSGVITYALTGTRAGLTTYGTDAVRRFDDFKVLAAPNVTGTRLGDCLGNSGIEFTTASGTARDGGGVGVKRYAVAAGNFSSTAMWSETSGGSPGASVPLPQDDVYLDANSAAGTYAINMPRSCRNLDCTGFTRTLNNSASDWSLYGNLKIVPGMTWSFTSIGPNLRGRGTQTIDTSGIVPGGGITNTNIKSPGGSYTLLSNLSLGLATQSYFGHFAGTFNANGFDVTTGRIDSPGSLVRTLNLGSGTWRVGYNTPFVVSISATTSLVADSSTIIVDSVYTAERSFTAPTGSVFGTVTYTVADSPGALTITGSNTFNTINIGSGRSLKLTSGTTQKIGTLNLNGVPRGGVRLPGVVGSYLSTPDSAAVSVTGDIDIRCRVALPDYTIASDSGLVTKYGAAGQRSFRFYFDSVGRLNFNMSTDGTANTGLQWQAGPTFVDGTTYWVRTTRTAAGTLRFFYAADQPTMPTSWTEAGLSQTLSAGQNIFDSTSPVEIGSMTLGTAYLANGVFYRAQIRNNVLDDGSGIVFDTDFSPARFWPFFLDSANGAAVTPSTTLANVGDGRVVIESSTAGTGATLEVGSVTGMNYVDLKDVVMNGADTYIEATSVIRSNVKGVRRGPKTGMSMMMGV